MLIVLDTDVILRDPDLKSSNFDVLRDYLRKTGARVLLPEIVFEELMANRERTLAKRSDEANSRLRRLHKVTLVATPSRVDIDVAAEVKEYAEEVLNGLMVGRDAIVPYKDEYLRDIVSRALKRTKPCSSDGEEFRDAILWNTVKDIARAHAADSVVFISCNVTDFADKNRSLHPHLAREVEAEGLKLTYCDSLEAFNREHSVKGGFIDRDWLHANLNIDDLFAAAEPQIRSMSASYFEFHSGSPTQSRVTQMDMSPSRWEVGDYYVNQMEDGTCRVHVILESEIDIRFALLHPGGRSGQLALEGIGVGEREPDLLDLMDAQHTSSGTRVTAFLEVGVAVVDGSISESGVERVELAFQ